MKNVVELSLTERFINLLMVSGKKNCAGRIFSRAGEQFLQSVDGGGARVLPPGVHHRQLLMRLGIAVGNVQPSLECKKCRIAGVSRLIPAIVSQKRGCTLAMRWIIELARKRKRNSRFPLSRCLAQELFDAHQKQGGARQRRDQYHKLSEGNRGYLRYRWW